MTPHQAKIKGQKVGSLLLEWERQGIGRIKRATGEPDTAAGRARVVHYRAMLTDLYRDDQHGVLLAIRDGELSLRDAYRAWKRGTVHQLPAGPQLALVKTKLPTWLAETPNAHTRASRKTTWDALTALAPDAPLHQVPDLVAQLRASTADRGSWFNHARVNAIAFLRDMLGPAHPLTEAVRIIPERAERTRTRRPAFSPADIRTLLEQLGPMAPAFWSMCCTGMGPGEFWGAWELLEDRVAIHGTKTAQRDRIVPRIRALVPATGTVHLLRYYLNKATPRLTPYDARRCFARWMEAAGIPRTRRRLYMGHGAKDITDLYEAHDISRFLLEDATALAEYLGETPPPREMRKVG